MKDIISKETFEEMLQCKMIADARNGGLVIGRSHDDGNIYMIQQLYPENEYEYFRCLEGGEYIICHEAYLKYKQTILEINSYKQHGDKVDLYDVCKCNIILTQNEPYDKTLLIDYRGQFIVNKRATSKYLYEIDCINKLIF